MPNSQRILAASLPYVLFASFSLAVGPAIALTPDAITVYNNTMAVTNCATTDANGELKPNTKNTVCKVTVNSPGDKETRLAFESTVNVGTLLSPKEESRHIEYRAEKTNGKISKVEYSVASKDDKKPDVFVYEIGADGEYTKARVLQNGQHFALVTREMCQPMKSTIEAYGNESVANCGVILQKLAEPLKVLQSELKKDGLKLGFPQPSLRTSSMIRMNTLNPERMGDAVGFVSGCASLFANEAAKKEADAKATAPKPDAAAGKPAAANQ